ncbi:GDSL-type esterase/lipase family protein [uncultured Desulfobacter sp.]|uniref:GDSL-type esterase/lipase family protein n=1 Tax=uncultured Desulfobacter sp. TaxID=240139 RepID=UPI002AABEBCD|nr:GDSL-type esterase/lipase family protein [uncultured Desulfobacter sp.]
MFWYNAEIEQLQSKPVNAKGQKSRLLFYGSSSLRLWPDAPNDFPDFEIINQAFGGSTSAACCWFFKRLIPRYQPDLLVFYAGDNDLGEGRHPEEVFICFNYLMSLIDRYCGNIPVAFISVKPSIVRQDLINSIKFTNSIIRREIEVCHPNCTFVNIFDSMMEANNQEILFEEDGLHLSINGYTLWKKLLKEQFLNKFLD